MTTSFRAAGRLRSRPFPVLESARTAEELVALMREAIIRSDDETVVAELLAELMEFILEVEAALGEREVARLAD